MTGNGGPNAACTGRSQRSRTGDPALIHAAEVFHVSLDEPLRDLEVEERYREAHVVVSKGGSVVGELVIPGAGRIPGDFLAGRIAAQLGRRIYDRWLAEAVGRAARRSDRVERPAEAPAVSVVVCTRDRPDQLAACLDSLEALRTAPQREVVVVDNSASDDRHARRTARGVRCITSGRGRRGPLARPEPRRARGERRGDCLHRRRLRRRSRLASTGWEGRSRTRW